MKRKKESHVRERIRLDLLLLCRSSLAMPVVALVLVPPDTDWFIPVLAWISTHIWTGFLNLGIGMRRRKEERHVSKCIHLYLLLLCYSSLAMPVVTLVLVPCLYRLIPTNIYRSEHGSIHMLGPGF